MVSRRNWLQGMLGIGLTSISYGSIFESHNATRFVQQEKPKRLKFLTEDIRNGEPDLNDLVKSWITPNELFYVRSHAPNPKIDPNLFRLKIQGKVRRPLEISLGQLRSMRSISTIATMTCAGNRRTEFNNEKKVGGVQWGAAAIGNAKWTGVSLADVLRRAEVLDDAKHIWFEGLDSIKRDRGTIPFGASIPIEKAMIDSGAGVVLLCDRMNGVALGPDHGFPLRVVVPGYIGARSVKWLGKIVVSDRPSPNHYVARAYKVIRDWNPLEISESGPIYRFPINAATCSTSPNSKIEPSSKILVTGYALPTGISKSVIKQVQVSTDDGNHWLDAEITTPQSDFCWSLWSINLTTTTKTRSILVRATDTTGHFMPEKTPWNAKGYLQNSWHRTAVEATG